VSESRGVMFEESSIHTLASLVVSILELFERLACAARMSNQRAQPDQSTVVVVVVVVVVVPADPHPPIDRSSGGGLGVLDVLGFGLGVFFCPGRSTDGGVFDIPPNTLP